MQSHCSLEDAMNTFKELQITGKEKNVINLRYVTLNRRYCIFSMISTPVKGDNTTYNVLKIISEVASREKVPVLSMRYFDFQTSLSSSLSGSDYAFLEAVVKLVKPMAQPKLSLMLDSWKATECPNKVLFTFRLLLPPQPKMKPHTSRQVVPF